MTTQVDSVRQQLRFATRDRHVRMEAVMDLTTRAASRTAFAALLDRIHGFYAPLESRLAMLPWTTVGIDFAVRRKTHWLVDDLRALGTQASGQTCPWLPALDTLAAGLGALYVLEGATLGGQVISRDFARPGAAAARGSRFFTSYGADTGARWREFVEVLDACCREPRETADAVAGACATFDCYGDWIAGLDSLPSCARIGVAC